jgi:hypothetical protein
MAYRTAVDAVAVSPTTGKLGLTTPSQSQLHDQHRAAVREIADKLDAEHGTGDLVSLFATGLSGHLYDAREGTSGAPITTSGPTFKVSRTETITRATVEAAGSTGTDGADQVGAIMGISTGVGSTQTQPIGIMGVGLNQSTNTLGGIGAVPDACGIYGIGRITGSGVGVGIGGFFLGRRDTTTANACGLEANSANFTATDAVYSTTGFSPAHGIWINASGNADSAAGITVSNPFGRQFSVGLAFTAQVANSKTGGVKDASIRDDSTSSRSINIKGTHSTAAIGIAAGAGNVGIGTESPGSDQLKIVAGGDVNMITLVASVSHSAASAIRIRDYTDGSTVSELNPFGNIRSGSTDTSYPAFAHTGDPASGFGMTGSSGVFMSTNSTVRQRWDNAGIQIGPTLALGGGVGVIGITNASVVPSTNPSGGGVMYVESGFLKYRGSSGTVTTLANA